MVPVAWLLLLQMLDAMRARSGVTDAALAGVASSLDLRGSAQRAFAGDGPGARVNPSAGASCCIRDLFFDVVAALPCKW